MNLNALKFLDNCHALSIMIGFIFFRFIGEFSSYLGLRSIESE